MTKFWGWALATAALLGFSIGSAAHGNTGSGPLATATGIWVAGTVLFAAAILWALFRLCRKIARRPVDAPSA